MKRTEKVAVISAVSYAALTGYLVTTAALTQSRGVGRGAPGLRRVEGGLEIDWAHARAGHVKIAVLLCILVFASVCAGCGAGERQASPRRLWREKPFSAIKPPPPPAWRTVDRSKLATDLGWWDVTRGSQSGKRIALTFDAGSGGECTPAILDTLKAEGLHCTFFITGQFAEAYPSLVTRMALDGHELGNHSWSHPRFSGLNPEEVASQISRTEARVRKLTGLSTEPYFRFPYGWKSNALIRQVNDMGYLSVSWTFDSFDSVAGVTAETIRSRVNKYACAGAIVLMHCGSAAEAQALPSAIADLKAAGYEPVALTEVLVP